jgi:hypothetical protein
MRGSTRLSRSAAVCALAVLAGCLALLAPSASPAAHAKRHACTGAASSITARVVDGRIVESQPVVTGCLPR